MTRNYALIYGLEAKYELLKMWRVPAFTLPTIGFPIVFYVLFGLTLKLGAAGPVTMSTYLVATYGCFGVIGAAFFGFGVGVATERGQGWMLAKRVSPMPIGAYFAAKIFMSLVFGSIIVAALSTLGILFGGVQLPLATWAALISTLIVGTLPFCAMGLMIGYLVGPNSAPGVVNLIFLPMAFASGLWIPIAVLPGFMKAIAHALPAYRYSQLALKTIGADMGEPVWTHLLYLVVFTLVALGLAFLAYSRDEGKMYG